MKWAALLSLSVWLAIGGCTNQIQDATSGSNCPSGECGPDAGGGSPEGGSGSGDGGAGAGSEELDAGEGSAVPDGGLTEFCGEPIPTTAADPLSLDGPLWEYSVGNTGFGDATVNAYLVSTPGTSLISQTVGVENYDYGVKRGNFALDVPTAGQPLDLVVSADVAGDGWFPTQIYSPFPYAEDRSLAIEVHHSSAIYAHYYLHLVDAGVFREPDRATIDVDVIDCDGAPLQGATVTSSAGTVFYGSSNFSSPTATATTEAGRAYVVNVSPGEVTLSGTHQGEPLFPITLEAQPNTLIKLELVRE